MCKAVDFPTLEQMFARDNDRWRGRDLWLTGARGFKEMAFFLGCDERTLRAAYRKDAFVRKMIYKHGGRYWAPLGNLMNLIGYLRDRQRQALGTYASGRSREVTGQFKPGHE
jgi:hypothetical protein